MTEPTLDHLAEMIANLGDHIARRAKEIAEPLVAEAEERCAQTISQVRQAAMATKQRADDLERELRIQLDYAVRRAERAEAAREETLRNIGMHPDQIAERERDPATRSDDRSELLARIHAPVLREAADTAAGEDREDVAVWLRDAADDIETQGRAVRGNDRT